MASTVGQRVDFVDFAKGICIIFVVMMHCTLQVEEAYAAQGWMHYVIAFAKPFRMPDFFFISGLFMARVLKRDVRSFIDRRIFHFHYFYLLWLTLRYVVKAPAIVGEVGWVGFLSKYIASIFYEPYGTLWFIWMLPVFAVVLRLSRVVPNWLIFIPAAGLEIAPIHTGNVAVDEFSSRFVYFFLGYSLAPLAFTMAKKVLNRPKLAMIGVVLWALVNGGLVFGGYAELPGVSLLLGLLGALSIICLAAAATLVSPLSFLRFFGERSLIVYLGFFIPMKITRFILLKTEMISDVGTVSVLVTLAAVIGSIVMWWILLRFGVRFPYERPSWARFKGPPQPAH